MLRLYPSHAPAHLELGRLLWRKGLAGEAATYFRRALEFQPDSARTCTSLGDALNQAGDLAGAHAALQRALELDPRDSKTHHLLGRVFDRLGRPDEAREMYERSRSSPAGDSGGRRRSGAEAVDAVLRPADATLAPVGVRGRRGWTRRAARASPRSGGPATPLEAGAAVVTGGGDLAAGFVLHVVIADERGRRAGTRSGARWCPPGSAPATGAPARRRAAGGRAGPAAHVEEAARAAGRDVSREPERTARAAELRIVVDATEDRDVVEAIVRRTGVIRLHS